MLQSFYEKVGSFILKRRTIKETGKEHFFNNFVENSLKFLVIMPFDDSAFGNAESVLQYLKNRNKNVSLLLKEHKVNTLHGNSLYQFIPFAEDDINKISLPNKDFTDKIEKKQFDVVIDLNLNVNLFSFAVSYLSRAKFRVGFTKSNSDYYYNFQIPRDKTIMDNSYGNLVNCLKMF
ncbi:MAG: hypothetical protein PVH88_03235 [Ignavibacteria bacterium]|jgi:hypothetical protein